VGLDGGEYILFEGVFIRSYSQISFGPFGLGESNEVKDSSKEISAASYDGSVGVGTEWGNSLVL